MASKGIYQYTVQESNNAGLGQGGSVYLNTASTTFTPTNGVIIAIQVLGDGATFSTLTPEDTNNTARSYNFWKIYKCIISSR